VLPTEYDILATSGDTSLGGEDFDNKITDLMAAHFDREVDYRQTIRYELFATWTIYTFTHICVLCSRIQ
jgi:hypothetical protein